MNFRTPINTSRALVLVLLFNMIAPVVSAADEVGNATVLICTSAGLIRVDMPDLNFSNGLSVETGDQESGLANSSSVSVHGEHCLYCKVSELPDGIRADLPPYPAPESCIALNYRSVLPTRAAQHISDHTRLRAPPLNTLV